MNSLIRCSWYFFSQPKICVILGQESVIYDMHTLVAEAVIISVGIGLLKADQRFKLAVFNAFNVYLVGTAPEKLYDILHCAVTANDIHKLMYKIIAVRIFMHICRTLGRNIEAETLSAD